MSSGADVLQLNIPTVDFSYVTTLHGLINLIFMVLKYQ